MSPVDLTEVDRHLMRERVFSWMSLDGGLLCSLIPPAQRGVLDESARRTWVQELVAQALPGNEEAQMRVLTREAAAALRRQAEECSAFVLKDGDSARALADTIGLMIAELKTVWDLLEASSHPDSSLRCSYEAAHLELLTVFVICIVFASFSKGAAAPDFDAAVAHEVFHSIIDVNFTEGNLEALSSRLSALMTERGRLMSDLFGQSVSGISDADRPLPATLLKGLTEQFSMASAGKYALSFLDQAAFDGCWLVNMLELERSYASGVLVRRGDVDVEATRRNACDGTEDDGVRYSSKSLGSPAKTTQQKHSNDELKDATRAENRLAKKVAVKQKERSSATKVRAKKRDDVDSDDNDNGDAEGSPSEVIRTTRILTQKSVTGDDDSDREKGSNARDYDAVAEERVAKQRRVADRNKSRARRDDRARPRTKEKTPILAILSPVRKPPSVAKVAAASEPSWHKPRKTHAQGGQDPDPQSRSCAESIVQDGNSYRRQGEDDVEGEGSPSNRQAAGEEDSRVRRRRDRKEVRVARQGHSSASEKRSRAKNVFKLSPRPSRRKERRTPAKPVRDTQGMLDLYGEEEDSDEGVEKNAASEDDDFAVSEEEEEEDSVDEEEEDHARDDEEDREVVRVTNRRGSSRGKSGDPSRARSRKRRRNSGEVDSSAGELRTDRVLRSTQRSTKRQRVSVRSKSGSDPRPRKRVRRSFRQRAPIALFDITSDTDSDDVSRPKTRSRQRSVPQPHDLTDAATPPRRSRSKPRRRGGENTAAPRLRMSPRLRVEIEDDDDGGGGRDSGGDDGGEIDASAPARRPALRPGTAARTRARRLAGSSGALGFSRREDVVLVQLIAKYGYGEWADILGAGRRAGLFRGRRARELGARARELARELDISTT